LVERHLLPEELSAPTQQFQVSIVGYLVSKLPGADEKLGIGRLDDAALVLKHNNKTYLGRIFDHDLRRGEQFLIDFGRLDDIAQHHDKGHQSNTGRSLKFQKLRARARKVVKVDFLPPDQPQYRSPRRLLA